MNTMSFTGRAMLRDVKAGISRATLELTDDALVVRGNFRRREHLRVPRAAITSVTSLAPKRGAIHVEFDEARWGRLLRTLTSGGPPGARNRIILNVDATEAWLAELTR
jgi:hypothetical protein